MKRLIVIVLTGILALMLVSCGQDRNIENQPAPTETPTAEPVVTVYPQVNTESEEAYLQSMREIISYIESSNDELKSELLKNVTQGIDKLKETADIYSACVLDMESDKIKNSIPESYAASHDGMIKAINAYAQLCSEASASFAASGTAGIAEYLGGMEQSLKSADELWNSASSVYK